MPPRFSSQNFFPVLKASALDASPDSSFLQPVLLRIQCSLLYLCLDWVFHWTLALDFVSVHILVWWLGSTLPQLSFRALFLLSTAVTIVEEKFHFPPGINITNLHEVDQFLKRPSVMMLQILDALWVRQVKLFEIRNWSTQRSIGVFLPS